MKLKIFALVLILAMACGMLVACKPTPDGPPHIPDDIIVDDSHYDSIWWGEDTFIFRLQENSSGEQLPSTCARYMAGDTDMGLQQGERADEIDDMVDVRNAKATATTKMTPIFTYITDNDTDKGWGANIQDMLYDANNFIPDVTPDAYCNFVYDMLCASLSGAFANLKTTTKGTVGASSGDTKNYFRFTNPLFQDTGEGYMVEYMRSLSLSRTKQYCLSSDYFTDMIRAFFVVPVNINLLETFTPSTEYGDFNYDYTGDGKYDIEDFYRYVWDDGDMGDVEENDEGLYKWTYNTIAEIAATGFWQENASLGNPTGDSNGCLNDRLVFAISEHSGLSPSGMLYTTSVTIIERQLTEIEDGDGNKYTDYLYWYPADNQDLYDFCDALKSLMSENKGVISVGAHQTLDYVQGSYADMALIAIRDRFVNNRILFGGDICLGSLEYNVYREMEDGFGVVPVPLFRQQHTETDAEGTVTTVKDEYLTQIHNVGRIGGINAKTEKFAKISAYFDFQSMYSTEILEEYYDVKLCAEVASGGSHAEMLDFIRANVRTSFDKAFEDAIGNLFASKNGGSESDEAAVTAQSWHHLIKINHYEIDSGTMAVEYERYVGSSDSADNAGEGKTGKAGYLDTLEKSYVGLPA